jgi:hypothetical protein
MKDESRSGGADGVRALPLQHGRDLGAGDVVHRGDGFLSLAKNPRPLIVAFMNLPGWREDVRLADVALRWDTNLPDDDLFDFYLHLREDTAFMAYIESPAGKGFVVSVWGDEVPFRDGLCWCFALFDHVWVIYRTKTEWAIWQARRDELAELSEAQTEEERRQIELCRELDSQLWARMCAALDAGDERRAEGFLYLRVKLLQQSPWKAIRALARGSPITRPCLRSAGSPLPDRPCESWK